MQSAIIDTICSVIRAIGCVMPTRKPEGETYEEKSKIVWSVAGKQLDLLKTIVAFANCSGGQLCIVEYEGDARNMDAARLHDFVAKYVSPSITGLETKQADDGSWTINVRKSADAPHVIRVAGNYRAEDGTQKPAFHPGQVYVRHSSKSEPATAQDLQRLIREGVSSWLSSLGEAVARVGITEDGDDKGIPMRLVEGGPALSVSFRDNHPYSATALGEPFAKTGAWIGKMLTVEGMRDDPIYTRVHNMYSNPIYTYSEAAKQKVAEILTNDPDYNPYRVTAEVGQGEE